MNKPATHVIAAVIGSSLMCYRQLQLGINAFAHANGNWHVGFCPHTEDYVEFIRRLGASYLILGPVHDDDKARHALSLVKGAVGLCGYHSRDGLTGIPEVEVDDYRVGALAARHFIEKQFKHFGYVGVIEAHWSTERFRGFSDELLEAGHKPSLFEQLWQSPSLVSDAVASNPTLHLIDWIRQQPKPLAIMVCNDRRAAEITQSCRDHGIHVPDDVAILGVDNDDLSCALSWPPLSSVVIPWQRAGYLAADILQQKIARKRIKAVTHLVTPTRVAERQSTDVIAIEDYDLRTVVQFIRSHANHPISVNDLLKIVPLTRRALERRFRARLGRTPLEEIRAAQCARAKSLLTTTELTLEQVARGSGFSDVTWFIKSFKDLCGETPAHYRRRHIPSNLG